MPSPRSYCYIIILPEEGTDTEGLITVPFDTMPSTITDSKQALWQDTAIIARSAPLKTYQFSGARTITFSLDFFISLEANDLKDEKLDLIEMKHKLDTLRGLVYPNNSPTMRRPRKCLFRMGEAFGMIAFCKSVSVIYRGDSPWNLNPMLAHHATVNLVLEETGEKIYTFGEVRADKELKDVIAVQNKEGVFNPSIEEVSVGTSY
jgi:hypothetical protein